jgi:hypothetical protein
MWTGLVFKLPPTFFKNNLSFKEIVPKTHFFFFFIKKYKKTMKVSKSLIKVIAVAVTISVTATACDKDKLTPNWKKFEQKKSPAGGSGFDCPGCGMG